MGETKEWLILLFFVTMVVSKTGFESSVKPLSSAGGTTINIFLKNIPAKPITRLITLAIRNRGPSEAYFTFYRPPRQCVISEEVSTRGAQRPAEHSLIPSLVCAAAP